MFIFNRCLYLFALIFLFLMSKVAISNPYSSKPIVQNPAQITNQVASYYQSIKDNKLKLKIFIQKMPKGGDLHSHLGLSVYAEDLIEYALADKHNYCLDQNYKLHQMPKCDAKDKLISLREFVKSDKAKDLLIDNWSIRNYNKFNNQPPFNYFFNVYSKYNAIRRNIFAQLIEKNAINATQNNISYLELMDGTGQSRIMKLAKKVKWNDNFEKLKKELFKQGMNNTVNKSSKEIYKYYADFENNLKLLDKDSVNRISKVKIRFLNITNRNKKPKVVFAQLVHSFELCKKNNLVVGINLLGEENYYYSTKDYDLHMRMINYLKNEYPNVKISLHTGELTEGLAPPEELTYHINSAVKIAIPDRIGHGVSIAYEKNPFKLLNEMEKKKIAVEINLTSNAFILGVKGEDHPLPLYHEYKVPIVICTDDQGALRTSINKEYFLAASRYNFSYPELKSIVKNSINYSFASGESIYLDSNYSKIVNKCKNDKVYEKKLSKSCQDFLNKNEKANLEWDLEKRFYIFEKNILNL